MDTENDMPKIPYVFLRGGVFWIQKRVPSDLVEEIGSVFIKQSLLSDEIRTASAMVGTSLSNRRDAAWTFYNVETYFEALDSDPVGAVRSIHHLLRGFTSKQVHTEWSGNAISLRYTIRNGVELCIYAKTNQRIRFEVRHDLTIYMPSGTGE